MVHCTSNEGLREDAVELHARSLKSGYFGLCCADLNKKNVIPQCLWKCNSKSLGYVSLK